MPFPIIPFIIAAAGTAIASGIRSFGQAGADRAAARGEEAQRQELLELINQINSADTTSSRIDSAVRGATAAQAARGVAGGQIASAETAGTVGRIVSEDEARRQELIARIRSNPVFAGAREGDLQNPLVAGLLGALGGAAQGAATFAGANPGAFAGAQAAPATNAVQVADAGKLGANNIGLKSNFTGAGSFNQFIPGLGSALGNQQGGGGFNLPIDLGALLGNQNQGQEGAQFQRTAAGFLPLLVPRARAGQQAVFP